MVEQAFLFAYYISIGDTLGSAFGRLETSDPEDLTGCLQLLFCNGSVTGIQ